MRRRLQLVILLAGLLLLLSILGLWAWSTGMSVVVAALPSQYRQRLPHELLQLVTTPLPAALPAPSIPIDQPQITIPAIILATVTAEHVTQVPTATAVSTQPPNVTKEAVADIEMVPQTSTPSLPPTYTPLPSPTLSVPTPTAPLPTISPLPSSFRLEGLQIIPQKFNNCGPANLGINLSYYGFDVHQLDIGGVIKPNYDDRNVSPGELVQYVHEQTPLRATLHSGGDLILLKRLIASGFPVVIEKGLEPSEWEGWMGHYLTLYGYDDVSEEFHTLDTFLGPWEGGGRSESYESITRQWGHFNYTFFVVYPPEREVEVYDILGTSLLDPVSMWQHGALKAQAEIETAPENAFAWFNLGTNLTHLGRLTGREAFFESAVAAFDQARAIGLPPRMLWYQFTPYEAYLVAGRAQDVFTLVDATLSSEGGRNVEETYLYQGHAFQTVGETASATAAYRRALELNPNFALARQALEKDE